MRSCLSIGLVVFALSVGSTVAASPPTPPNLPPNTAAQKHYHTGQVAYDQGRYREAALEFDEAYTMQTLPALLFNEAQAWRHEFQARGDRAAARRAIDCYSRYLASPHVNDDDRREAADHLGTLSSSVLDPAMNAADLTGTPVSAATPPPTDRRRQWLWIGVGAGAGAVVVLALGLGLGLGLRSSNDPQIKAQF